MKIQARIGKVAYRLELHDKLRSKSTTPSKFLLWKDEPTRTSSQNASYRFLVWKGRSYSWSQHRCSIGENESLNAKPRGNFRSDGKDSKKKMYVSKNPGLGILTYTSGERFSKSRDCNGPGKIWWRWTILCQLFLLLGQWTYYVGRQLERSHELLEGMAMFGK